MSTAAGGAAMRKAVMHEPGGIDLESTVALLARIRSGDAEARELLLRRYLPPLRRWARGRLPHAVRSLAATDDLVQETLISVLKHVSTHAFEQHRDGAFLLYLRKALHNKIIDLIRQVKNHPPNGSLPAELAEERPSPLEALIGREKLEAYERALSELSPQHQEALLMRIELGLSYSEIALAIGSPSPNAARMVVSRAVVRLVEVLNAS